jgi:hypothetical protein
MGKIRVGTRTEVYRPEVGLIDEVPCRAGVIPYPLCLRQIGADRVVRTSGLRQTQIGDQVATHPSRSREQRLRQGAGDAGVMPGVTESADGFVVRDQEHQIEGRRVIQVLVAIRTAGEAEWGERVLIGWRDRAVVGAGARSGTGAAKAVERLVEDLGLNTRDRKKPERRCCREDRKGYVLYRFDSS